MRQQFLLSPPFLLSDTVTNDISFHARVGRFSPFFVFEECGPLIPMECGHSSDFVLASTCSPRLPVFLGFPYSS